MIFLVAYRKFNQFSADLCKGVHNFTSDATCKVTVALTNADNQPLATDSVLADLTQIDYTNLSSRVVTGISCGQNDGIAHLKAGNLELTASGLVATFRYIVLYNDKPKSDQLIAWYDYGRDMTMAGGDVLPIEFPDEILTLGIIEYG